MFFNFCFLLNNYFCNIYKKNSAVWRFILSVYMEEKEEAKLIHDLKGGSIMAFNSLYDIYFSKVWSYCLQISKSPQKASDITQEVFLKLWEHRRNIRSDNSLNPFLFRIAKNQLISAYREAVNSKIYEDYVMYTHSPGAVKSSSMEYKDFLKILNKSFIELPRPEREVIMLSRFRMMKNQEIAHHLGLSEQTVKNRLVSGIRHLKEILRKYDHFSLILLLIPYIQELSGLIAPLCEW